MNTKRFLDKITQNWPTKVLCLVVALFIYFFHQMSILEKKTFTVPLETKANGSMISASENNRYVKVTLRGKRDEVSSVTNKDISAYLDISDITQEGEYTFPVLIDSSPRLLLIEPLEVRVSPEKVSLKVETRTIKYVPVEPLLSGEVAHGFEQTSISVEPATIKIEGPRQMIESITAVQTEAVDIEGIQRTTTRDVLLQNENKLITFDDETPVSVTVTVAETGMKKDISDIQILYYNLADNLEVKSPVERGTVTIEGSQLILEKMNDKQVVLHADCSAITTPGTYEAPVTVSVPTDTTVISQSVQEIKVTVVERSAHQKKDEDSLQ